MTKQSFRFTFAFLFLLVTGVLAYAQVQAGNFAPGRLDEHYWKHGYQFGHITEEQYLHDAQALLDASPGADVLEKIRPDSDVEHFRESTGEFAVMTKRGRIRTYFKTDYIYWIRH